MPNIIFKHVLIFTIDGTENKYAQRIFQEYENIKKIKFVGEISRKQVYDYYQMANAIIFPSKTETWGMGISEAMAFEKPVIAIDAPYSRETIGNYAKIKFFSGGSPNFLAQIIENFIKKLVKISDKKLYF